MFVQTALAAGFDDPVFDSQKTFRTVMDAMARPGSIKELAARVRPPAPLNGAAAALLLTLADFETPVWFDAPLTEAEGVIPWLRFHTGAPIVTEPIKARFAVVSDGGSLPSLARFSPGSQEYPDESTTVIIQVAEIREASGPILTGPGIETTARMQPSPLNDLFWSQAIDNGLLFPRGLDVIFAAPEALAALPRSTRIERQT